MNVIAGKKVLLVVASDGYQQKEYLEPKKILEENNVIVVTASDKAGGAVAKDLTTTPVDVTLDAITITDYAGIFFIGGSGAMKCLDNSQSYHLLSQAKKHNIPYGAICISSRILAKAHALEGKRATGWNGDNALPTLLTGYKATYVEKDFVIDGTVVTAVGPQAARDFGLAIVEVVTEFVLSQKS